MRTLMLLASLLCLVALSACGDSPTQPSPVTIGSIGTGEHLEVDLVRDWGEFALYVMDGVRASDPASEPTARNEVTGWGMELRNGNFAYLAQLHRDRGTWDRLAGWAYEARTTPRGFVQAYDAATRRMLAAH